MSPNPLPITPPGPAQSVPFDSGRWLWSAGTHRVEDYLGRKSLYLAHGIATVADVSFADGWIEFDMAFSADRGFMGAIWRAHGTKDYEEFYLRPHQSGNPDASQYTPVFHGIEGWQLYHGKRYSVPLIHRFNEWIHVKVVFSGQNAEVYVKDMENPVLFIDGLKRGVEAGGIGVNAGDFAPAHFSRFSFTVADSPRLKGRAGSPAPVPAGVIPSWNVSDSFPESALDAAPGKSEGRNTLGRDLVAARRWTRLAAEPSGLTDLARVQGLAGGNDTVLVRQGPGLEPGADQKVGLRVLRSGQGLPQRPFTVSRRRYPTLQGLPVPGQHRLVRCALPAARPRRERDRDGDLGGRGGLGCPGETGRFLRHHL